MSTDPVTLENKSQEPRADSANQVGRFSPDAFDFLREGLDFTVRRKHGPAVEKLRGILEWLESHELEVHDLPAAHGRAELPTELSGFIDENGGPEAIQGRLNLHVGGEELCWGLRDLAQERWGLMAPAVLSQWGVRSTRDFGRMVFALVDQGLLQKQPHDCLGDFAGVFDFATAFDRSYRIDLAGNARQQKRTE